MARKSAAQTIADLKKIKDKRQAIDSAYAAIEEIEKEIDPLRTEKQAIRDHIRELEGPVPKKERPDTSFKIGKTAQL